ncbi:hypothetical protein [Peribacillus simplex]|uniref:hypothetical protein n=1 Tax=Peribacillus simplex TaxID=1478 RepID=UPI001C87831D|nr:hypothetical protein [Peribacillus simplex]
MTLRHAKLVGNNIEEAGKLYHCTSCDQKKKGVKRLFLQASNTLAYFPLMFTSGSEIPLRDR